MSREIEVQRSYYANTASDYEEMYVNEKDEHYLALCLLESIFDFYEIKSILDIVSGTGRVASYIKKTHPNIRIVSVEPVKVLREIGYQHGFSQNELVDGDATSLKFKNEEFDLVCEFAVLHDIKLPSTAVLEMLRVSKKAIFISDSKNFGEGSYLIRTIKQIFNALGVWRYIDLIKTKGKGYTISKGDGLAYSYSVFNNYHVIR